MVKRGIEGVCVKIYSVGISIDFQPEDSMQLLIHYKKVSVNKKEEKVWGGLCFFFFFCEHCRKTL